jgi:predicted house-cleaning noncanonical NTP pyrophosphatase (MazG superfamily)
MPRVSPNAWKILCLAMRKTAGWADISTYSGRKESDVISISQFRDGCGIGSNTTVEEAIKECVELGYLLQEKDGKSFRYHLNVEYELPDDTITVSVNETITDSVNDTITESVKTNNKTINSKDIKREEYLKSVEARKRETEESIKKFEEKNNIPHLGEYPEDVRHILTRIFSLWKIALPSRKSVQYGYWLRGARELDIVCEGHPDFVLDEIYKDESGKRPPDRMTISSPKSLINMARAKVGELKIKSEERPYIPQGASEVWIGGVCFK